MSSNTPNQPGEGSGFGNVPPQQEGHGGGFDPLANNPYSAQYRQGPAPDLDANAPILKSSDLKRMNRRALLFLGAIVALLAILGFWLIKGSHHEAPAKKPDAVVIPTAPPAPPPLPPSRTPPPPIPVVATNSTPVVPTPPPPHKMQQQNQPHGPTLLDRRIAAAGGDNAPAPTPPAAAGQQGSGSMPGQPGLGDGPTSAQPILNPDTLLVRGTYIRCVLETRIITDIPGFSSCIVTEPVYSINGHRLLLPKGSKVLGKYGDGGAPAGDRVAVVWDRIVTPNGIDINMSSPGIDDLGGAGYPGYVNSHWVSRISSALLISILSDAFSYEAAEHGPKTSTATTGGVVEQPFQSNTAQTLQQLAGQAVRKSANRPVTVTINQGTIVDIYVSKDVDFSGVVARF